MKREKCAAEFDATVAGANPAAGKGLGACATTMRMGRIRAAARSAWRA